MLQILRGDHTHLPPQASTVVRVFVSSTFGGEQRNFIQLESSVRFPCRLHPRAQQADAGGVPGATALLPVTRFGATGRGHALGSP